jgi:hypothetical protein
VAGQFQYQFEWDPRKARQNAKRHGVAFERAATIFLDRSALSEFDEALPQKSQESANGAEYESQGQARSASPLVGYTKEGPRPEGPKYASYPALSGLGKIFDFVTRGDALRACPWLSYSAPLALY